MQSGRKHRHRQTARFDTREPLGNTPNNSVLISPWTTRAIPAQSVLRSRIDRDRGICKIKCNIMNDEEKKKREHSLRNDRAAIAFLPTSGIFKFERFSRHYCTDTFSTRFPPVERHRAHLHDQRVIQSGDCR